MKHTHTHTHTHTHGILSVTAWVNWYKKGKTRKVKPICIYLSKR